MRIGTWNVDARWDQRHQTLIDEQTCDVWLLTETPETLTMPGFTTHVTRGRMSRQQHWAAILAHNVAPADDPDAATAAATVNGITVWSSVLPWPSCGPDTPWEGHRHDDRIHTALDRLRAQAPAGELIWGGDWNHTLQGRIIGSRTGRNTLLSVIEDFGLQVPTAALPHRLEGATSIDHIGIPATWHVRTAQRIRAEAAGQRLSDHDMYVIEVDRPPADTL